MEVLQESRFPEEGDRCDMEDCPGVLEYMREGDCYCHLVPPCHSCVEAPLTCAHCGWQPGKG
jgi:hypothetical protein